jgi:hypothetical protein
MASEHSRFTTTPKKITSTGEFAWGGEKDWSDDIDSSENIHVGSSGIRPADPIPASEVWDDWADTPTVDTLITDRETLSNVTYQGEDADSLAPSSGDRPEWEITQGDVAVHNTDDYLSLGRDAIVEYGGIDFSTVDISTSEIVIRFEYRYYTGQAVSSDAGFNLTVNNPGGGNADNFAGLPEDGWTMYFGGGSKYRVYESVGGAQNILIEGLWDTDTSAHTSELRINDAGADGLAFEYFYDGALQGTATSNAFTLEDINLLHWGNRDSTDAENNPVGINWLEVFTR